MCEDHRVGMGWGIRGGRGARRAVPVLLAAAVALPLAACGGAGSQAASRSAPAGSGAGSRVVPSATGTSSPRSPEPATDAPVPGLGQYALPTDEPSATTGPCPSSGLRAVAGKPDAAAGLRAVALVLTDCGAADRTVSGYPVIQVLGSDHHPVHVEVHRGITVTDAIDDPAPTTLRLRHGERAVAVLAWRDLVTGTGTGTSAPVSGSALRITVGGSAQTLPLLLDVGTTGRVDVTAWYQAG